MVSRNSPFYSYRWKRGWSWPCFDTTLPALLCEPQPHVHSKARILSRQLERIPQNQVGHLIYVYYTTLCFTIFMRIYWGRELLEKWGNQSKRQSSARKRVESVFSTKVHWLGLSSVLKQVSLQYCNDQRHVKYVKINRSRQLALDGVVDTHMDFISNDAGLSATYYLLFSSVFFLLLFTIWSCKTPIMYFEWRWQIWVWGILVTTTVKWSIQPQATQAQWESLIINI